MLTHSLWLYNCFSFSFQPEQKKDDLNATDDRESTEESHCASNETQLGLRLNLLVSLDVVKGCRVKVDPDKSKVSLNRYLDP